MERDSKRGAWAQLAAATSADREPLPESVLLGLLIFSAVTGLLVGPTFKTFAKLGEAIESRSMPLAVVLAVGVAVLAWGGELGGRAGGHVRVLARVAALFVSMAAVFLLGAFAWLRDDYEVIANESRWAWFGFCVVIAASAAPVFVLVRAVGRKLFRAVTETVSDESVTEPSVAPALPLGGPEEVTLDGQALAEGGADQDRRAQTPVDVDDGAGSDLPRQPAGVGPGWLPWVAVGASAVAVSISLDASRRARR